MIIKSEVEAAEIPCHSRALGHLIGIIEQFEKSNNCLPNAIEFGQIDADDRNPSIIIENQVDQLEAVESETVRQIIWLKWEQSIGKQIQ